MTKAGKIYPKLEAVLKRIYTVKVISEPNEFTSESFGLASSINVEIGTMKYNFVMSKSFRQQLLADMNRENMIVWNDDKTKITKIKWNELVNRYITFQKFKGNTKTMENVQLFSVELKPKDYRLEQELEQQ